MINTALIAFITQQDGGYDPEGNPVAPTETVSDYVACNLMQVIREYRVERDGEYTQAKYSVHLENDRVPDGIDLTNVDFIRLQDKNGVDLGRFLAPSKEPLAFFNTTKIIVL